MSVVFLVLQQLHYTTIYSFIFQRATTHSAAALKRGRSDSIPPLPLSRLSLPLLLRVDNLPDWPYLRIEKCLIVEASGFLTIAAIENLFLYFTHSEFEYQQWRPTGVVRWASKGYGKLLCLRLRVRILRISYKRNNNIICKIRT